jgi:hypothetical protein
MAEKTAAEKAEAAAARKAAREAKAAEAAEAKAAEALEEFSEPKPAKSPEEMTQGELQLFRAAEQAERDRMAAEK